MASFVKLHGIGNDFIVIDGVSAKTSEATLTDPSFAVGLCDRHRGIGGDGLILLFAPVTSDADARMVVINADGSRPEMCGNGIRCAAKFLAESREVLRHRDQIRIATDAGTLRCDVLRSTTRDVAQVKVEMGKPRLDREQLPMVGNGPFVSQPFSVEGETFSATAVSMGNPHLVIFVDDKASPEHYARTLGPVIERHPSFPKRTNVEFARLNDKNLGEKEIELWVWERGCGITQACGTGACATAVAARVTKRLAGDQPIFVRLPGGILTIDVAGDLSQVWMTGPATEVFRGTISI